MRTCRIQILVLCGSILYYPVVDCDKSLRRFLCLEEHRSGVNVSADLSVDWQGRIVLILSAGLLDFGVGKDKTAEEVGRSFDNPTACLTNSIVLNAVVELVCQCLQRSRLIIGRIICESLECLYLAWRLLRNREPCRCAVGILVIVCKNNNDLGR